MSKAERQKRWYEKLKSDTVRFAEFKVKSRKTVRAKYYADKLDPERREIQRANRRKAAKVQWQKIKSNPSKLQYCRYYSNRRCVNLSDEYVAERLKLTAETCPKELIDLMRAHIQLLREIRKPNQPK